MVRVEGAVAVAPERLRERLEAARGAEPREAVGELGHTGAEFGAMRAAHERVDAVGADDEVRIGELIQRRYRALVLHLDPHGLRALAQQAQQLEPPDGGKTDAVDADDSSVEVERDVRPRFQRRRDGVIRLRIVVAEEFQGALGKHDAEAECRIGGILLEHAHLRTRLPALEEV